MDNLAAMYQNPLLYLMRQQLTNQEGMEGLLQRLLSEQFQQGGGGYQEAVPQVTYNTFEGATYNSQVTNQMPEIKFPEFQMPDFSKFLANIPAPQVNLTYGANNPSPSGYIPPVTDPRTGAPMGNPPWSGGGGHQQGGGGGGGGRSSSGGWNPPQGGQGVTTEHGFGGSSFNTTSPVNAKGRWAQPSGSTLPSWQQSYYGKPVTQNKQGKYWDPRTGQWS